MQNVSNSTTAMDNTPPKKTGSSDEPERCIVEDAKNLSSMIQLMAADVEGIFNDSKHLCFRELKLSLRCAVLSFLFALGSACLLTLTWISIVVGLCLTFSAFGVALWMQVTGITLIHMVLVCWAWFCAKTFYHNIGLSRTIASINTLLNRDPAGSANDA